MKLDQGASVFTADGKDVGRVDRVVLHPKTKEVTHLVVRKGVIFTDDKVVPIDMVQKADADRVLLKEDVGDIQNLPVFEETHYVPLNEDERRRAAAMPTSVIPPLYWYPAYGAPAMAYPGHGGPESLPYITRTEENIPEGTVALKEGAQVISVDGKHVGNVEQVLTGPEGDRATHILVSQGVLGKTHKLVPMTWVDYVGEDQVRLVVGSKILDELREYQG